MAKKAQFGRSVRNLVASFRGLPTEKTSAFSREPKTLDGAISIWMRKHWFARVTAEQVIQENWVRIVGERFSSRCAPEKILKGDVLLIHSPSAVIRSELQLQKKKILENLRKFPHCAKISDIRFRF
jgi:hypothetical protein